MPGPETPADKINLLLRHHWPDAAQELAAVAALDGQLDSATCRQLDQRIPATAEAPVNRRHAVLGVAHDSVVSTLQLMPLTTEAEMRAAFTQAVRWIEIETSSQCNRRCTYCPNAEFDRLSGNDFLDFALYSRVLHDLASIAYDGELMLVGTNEIFMHERNFDYIAAARGALPGCQIKLFSNGDYLTREHIERLVELGVVDLAVTLHLAAGKPFDEAEVRARVAQFAKRVGVKLSLESEVPGRHIYFSARLGPLHLSAGLQNFAVTGHGWAGAVHDSGGFRRTAPCTYPIRQLVLNHDGDIFMCCVAAKERTAPNMQAGAVTGNMREFPSIFHAYASEKLLAWRRALLTNAEKSGPCRSCTGHADIVESQFRDLATKATRLLRWDQEASAVAATA
jgi:Radical SAM superfamily/Iron-sulfur cluster-binding domain